MPESAKPHATRKGRLSYTVTSPTTGAKVEVLIKGKAFRIIKMGSKDGSLVVFFRHCGNNNSFLHGCLDYKSFGVYNWGRGIIKMTGSKDGS